MMIVPLIDVRRIAFVSIPTDKSGMRSVNYRNVVGRMRLASEQIGTVSLSLLGVKNDSEVYVFDSNLTTLDGVESASDPQSFLIPYYSSGNPLNNIRILIASLGYENIDLSLTLTGQDVSIPIQQRIDRNYKNPI